LRIVFLDPISWDYRIDAPYHSPLGGSQSALCYLAEALVKQGHDVFLLNHTSRIDYVHGVICLSLDAANDQIFRSIAPNVVICCNDTSLAETLRGFLLDQDTRLLLWTGHSIHQPEVESLAEEGVHSLFDAIICVSEWQRSEYIGKFGIPSDRIYVLRNAISPFFQSLFFSEDTFLQNKLKPLTLAYTSTPFRGLNVLIDVFPEIRASVPEVTLKVFSSMKVYQVSEEIDQNQFGILYQKCQEMEGVEYVGSLPQAQLAQQLCQVTALAYPNTFPETSCIAVMEAMASGCGIITSHLGALPETTAGYGYLVPYGSDRHTYHKQFIQTVVDFLVFCHESPEEFYQKMQHQIAFVNESYTWPARAHEWTQILGSVIN
jgi:glycosyltransferase involved in cell wall biosynthesis